MTKTQLIDELHVRLDEKYGYSKGVIRAVLEQLPDVVMTGLHEDGEVVLPGIGKLKIARRAARTGRNPRTGETIEIPARPAAKFVPAKPFKTAIEEECA